MGVGGDNTRHKELTDDSNNGGDKIITLVCRDGVNMMHDFSADLRMISFTCCSVTRETFSRVIPQKIEKSAV